WKKTSGLPTCAPAVAAKNAASRKSLAADTPEPVSRGQPEPHGNDGAHNSHHHPGAKFRARFEWHKTVSGRIALRTLEIVVVDAAEEPVARTGRLQKRAEDPLHRDE